MVGGHLNTHKRSREIFDFIISPICLQRAAEKAQASLKKQQKAQIYSAVTNSYINSTAKHAHQPMSTLKLH